MADFYPQLNPEKALIWRIVHRDNLPWILDNGLHCGSSAAKAPLWVSIGNPELTDKRAHRQVPVLPGGALNDYVPFYFTPFSPMLLNIKTGRAGILQRANEEIVFLVSSIPHLQKLGISYLFTNSHAYSQTARFFSDPADLKTEIDWQILQQRDFKRDPDDLAKFERYQAEALVHQHLPAQGLLGVVCYTVEQEHEYALLVQARGISLKVHARPGLYF